MSVLNDMHSTRRGEVSSSQDDDDFKSHLENSSIVDRHTAQPRRKEMRQQQNAHAVTANIEIAIPRNIKK